MEDYVRFQESQDTKPISKNPAFGNILGKCSTFYIQKINSLEEFYMLYWCPKGENKLDEIDKMTNGTRSLRDITTYLEKTPWMNTEFFKDEEPVGEKRCLFLVFVKERYEIRDGLHRAGGIAFRLAHGIPFSPIDLYVAKVTE